MFVQVQRVKGILFEAVSVGHQKMDVPIYIYIYIHIYVVIVSQGVSGKEY